MAERGVPLSTLCPKYLHTNSTSHTWPFSAIAELIDNAYDPDVRAKQFWIDKTVVKEQECLSFMDNGNGLQHETMHKMLSFGYSDKKAINGQKPIGFYGNGFKSGSMRLGKDAIVFSKSTNALCVGMLSQTYLEKIGADQIIVPVVSFEPDEKDELRVRGEDKASLQDILSYSLFKTEEELLHEIRAISAPGTEGATGTRIIIWNLRRTSTGTTEFDFETDRYDIRIPSDMYETMSDQPQNSAVASIPQTFYSLRAFCSILYLKPWMQVMIRGQKVQSQLVKKSLAFMIKDSYKPTFLSKAVPITFGYNTKSKDQYGIMMYHKNRLIKAYERIGCQLRANNKGVGVIGVIECDFLEPTHNKQSFNETDKYRKTMASLGTKLEEYWKEMCHRRKQEDPNSTPVEDIEKRPDQNWVQCDDCLQWRKLPDGIDCKKLPDKWFCRLNPDPQYRSCKVPEEPEDSDDEQRSYHKTFKQLEREKKNQEKMRQKEEEDRKRQEQQRLDELTRENQALMRQHATLRRRLRRRVPFQIDTQEMPVHSPSAPSTPFTTPKSLTKRGVTRGQSSTASQAACSPSTSSGPVISGVYSLSQGNTRGKRAQPATPPSTPKRPRINSEVSDTPASVDVSPLSYTPAPVVNDDNDDDGTDDDISILETVSTPKPQKPAFDLTRVKTEVEESDTGTLLECDNGTAMDVASEDSVAESGPTKPADDGTSSSSAPPTEVASITTQTEALNVKREDEERAGQCEDQSLEQRGRTSENEGKQATGTGVTHHLDREDDSEPSCADACSRRDSLPHHPDLMEVQEQQDQLLELMQATAQERDIFKEQAEELARQLQDAQYQLQDVQSQLQELLQATVKKECFHQASQTEESEGGTDYKSLYEKTKHKADELIQEREALLEAIETKPKNGTDETALQIECLLRELDERNKERDGLRSQLDNSEGERANLAAKCEELRLSLQEQQRQNALKESSTGHQGTHSSVQTDPVEAGGTAEASGTDSIPNPSMSLIELRHNIGRLLVSFVPALDLNQVNYECNVIDEILEQVLSDVDAVTPARQ